MGYETAFELIVYKIRRDAGSHELRKICCPDLEKEGISAEKGSYLQALLDNEDEMMRWYDYDDDMIEFSRGDTSHLFRLTGVGDTNGDIWRYFYYNGVCWKWELEYEFPEAHEMPGLAGSILGMYPKKKVENFPPRRIV